MISNQILLGRRNERGQAAQEDDGIERSFSLPKPENLLTWEAIGESLRQR